MKRFIKSLIGKTVLFVLCVASVCAATFGVLQIVASYTFNNYLPIIVGDRSNMMPRTAVLIFIIGFALLALTCFVMLMYSAGRRNDSDEPHPGFTAVIPYDLILACVALVFITGLRYALKLTGRFYFYPVPEAYVFDFLVIIKVIAAIALYVCALSVMLGLCMIAAARLKAHVFLKGLLTYKILMLLKTAARAAGKILTRLAKKIAEITRNIPLIPKTALCMFAIPVFELFIIFLITEGFGYVRARYIGLLWFLEKLILCPVILYAVISFRKLQKGGEALAAGNLSYVTDTSGMLLNLKKHGEDLNSIAVGMNRAIDDRMKSEHMKTELITNVSHDIKTPLTSIINYATLIGEGKYEGDELKEYSNVLVRQSDKLKKLIEDLVEASKASTGNIEIIPALCNASIFITQASGEFEERLHASELTLITKLPEKELLINVDGRRMWRIFDNLLNNCCKYSLPGTRVYLSLEEKNNLAMFTFKNTSREPLDMSEEELMERFTRGDASRNTEGNGLGLAIAKSLTDLQGGTMNINVDGDLFKIILAFPLINF